MTETVEPSEISPASSGRRGRGSRSPMRWLLIVGLCAVAAVALPLLPFAWKTATSDTVHGANVRIEQCTREWLAYFPAWSCSGDYEPGDTAHSRPTDSSPSVQAEPRS
jgi:hypothetical protein